MENRQLRGRLAAPGVSSLAVSPDGNTLAAAIRISPSTYGIRLWDVPSQRLLGVHLTGQNISRLVFSSDSQILTWAAPHGLVLQWDMDVDSRRAACGIANRNLTREEWQTYFGDQLYRMTCPNLPIDPGFLAYGKKLAKEGKLQEAIAYLDTVQKSDPSVDVVAEAQKYKALGVEKEVSGLVERGKERARNGEVTDAIAAFNQAKSLKPTLMLDPEVEVRRAEVPGLVQKGTEAARAGEVAKAKEAFSQAKELDPRFTLDPETYARTLAVSALIQKATVAARVADVPEAKKDFSKAKELDPEVKIPAEALNVLCWRGSLAGHADEVLQSCEEAVSLDPENGAIRDSRGLARTFTRNWAGAIEDFKAYIAWTMQEKQSHGQQAERWKLDRQQRERWIADLQADRNPLDDPATVDVLRKSP